jgi:hypothetical protein
MGLANVMVALVLPLSRELNCTNRLASKVSKASIDDGDDGVD